MISRRILYVAAVCAVMYAGCDALFGPDSGPNAPQFSPPGGTYTQQQYVSVTGTGGSVYVSGDPDALLADFEPAPDTIHVPDDIVLRAYTIDDRGVRSPLSEASYIISDSTAPQIQSSGIHQENVSYREFTITWDVSEPDENGAGNPSDDATDWYNLEFSLFASTRNNIDTIDDALQNGTLVKDWHAQVTTSVGSAEYETSLAGETVYVNVFVRDQSGNTSGYGAVEMSTPPALDVYVGNGVGNDEIWLNTAEESAEFDELDPGLVAPTLLTTYGAALGDLDGDGYDDFVASYFSTNVFLAWFKARGNGSFDPASQATLLAGAAATHVSEDIVIADMDQDGTPDIVAGYRTGEGVDVFASDGTLLFTVPSGQTDRVSVGDFNGDGYPDIATSDYVPGGYTIWRNDSGTGVIAETPPEAIPNPTDILLDDLDNDGLADLVVASYTRTDIYISNGDGSFDTLTTEPASWLTEDPSRVATIDWNGDGNLDLILGSNTPTSFIDTRLYFGDGSGGFSFGHDAPSGNYDCRGIIVSDMDGDGDDDFVELVDGLGFRVWINLDGVVSVGPSPSTPSDAFAVGRLR